MVIQSLSIIGGIAQAETGNGPVIQTTPPPVGPGLGGLVHTGIQAGMEEPGRLLVHGKNPAAHPAGAVVLLRLGHAGPLGQQLDRLGITEGADLFYKGNDVAARPAAKAVKALGFRVDVKGRRFFVVEGTQPAVQPAFVLELNITAHHFHNVVAADQLFNVFVRYHAMNFPNI